MSGWKLVPFTQSFDDLPYQQVEGGWEYLCEGAGYGGCDPSSTIRTRKWTTVGKKHGGWLVCYALNDDGTEDRDIVLVLCPAHALPAPAAEGGDRE